MPNIAISYRRADSSAITGRIFDRLVEYYGEQSVFIDVDAIPIGSDFRSKIQEALRRSDVLLAVIGPNWIGFGSARIAEPDDPVRVEIATAMARAMPVIPILVEGAAMPQAASLPAEFGNFAFLNAAEVATGRDFRNHMDRLIDAIDRTVTSGSASQAHLTRPRAPPAAATGAPTVPGSRLTDVLRFVVGPLIVLLAAHHIVVNTLDLYIGYLWAAASLVPFAFGLGFGLITGRDGGTASIFAIVLGVLAAAAMTVSQSLNSGDPILPQSQFEWIDNAQFAGAIALSFFAGYALGRLGRLGARWL